MLTHAGIDLLHVGDQIAMGEHRALGQPRGATGVLQNGNILQTSRHDLQAAVAPQAQRSLEADGLRQMEFRDHLLDLVDNGIDQPALGSRLHVAHFHFDQVFDGRVRQHFLHQLAEQIEIDQRPGAGVLELMSHLPRGVQRVGVDHRQTGTHRTEYGDRVLQDIGHLYGNAVTRHQLRVLLQIRGEGGGVTLEFRVGQRHAHVAERRSVGEFPAAALKHLDDRLVGLQIHLGVDTRRTLVIPEVSLHYFYPFSLHRSERTLAVKAPQANHHPGLISSMNLVSVQTEICRQRYTAHGNRAGKDTCLIAQ